MANVAILVGSVYGGATLVAEEVQSALENHGHKAELIDEPEASALAREDIDIWLVCTSTTGAGDLPEDLVDLHAELVNAPPRIQSLRYAVIALGDSSYGDTFCGGGKQMDAVLSDIGGEQLSEPLILDAIETVTPEEDAVPWAVELVEAASQNS